MIKLIHPTSKYSDDIMEMRNELLEKDKINYIHGAADLHEYSNVEEWIHHVELIRDPKTCPAGLVDSDVYLALREDDNRVIGIAELRHHINHPILGTWGGHIGYSVRPSERRKGYGKIILRLILDACSKFGIHDVLLTCNEKNIASEKTIISVGGIYEKTVLAEQLNMNMKRYWIKLDK